MRTLSDGIRKFLAQRINEAVDGAFTLEELANQLVEPPDGRLGDLAFGCFLLAKTQKKAPAVLAGELQAKISLDKNLIRVAAAAELWLGKPVLAINAATYWHALRANGITEKREGCGRIFEEF
jgi:arginyl-tRNA synthetase